MNEDDQNKSGFYKCLDKTEFACITKSSYEQVCSS